MDKLAICWASLLKPLKTHLHLPTPPPPPPPPSRCNCCCWTRSCSVSTYYQSWSLWQNKTRRKLGGDSHGVGGGQRKRERERDWRSKLVPHVPLSQTLQACTAPRSVFPYSLPLAPTPRPTAPRSLSAHALPAVHTVPFSSAVPSQGTIYFFWPSFQLHKLTASEKPKES